MLCGRYYPAMTAVAYCVLRDRHLAEDAVQEAYARALEKLPALRKADKFAGWLKTICRNTAINMARQQKRIANIEDAEQVQAKNETENELKNEIQNAILKLPKKSQELVTMRYFADLSHQQIAEATNLTPAAVNAKLCRIRKKLEKSLCKELKIINDKIKEVLP